MNTNQITKLKREIRKIIFLIAGVFLPYLSNGQANCPILLDVIIDDFCFDPISASGTLTIVPVDPTADYNYSIDGGITFIPPGPGDSVFNVSADTYYIWIQEAANPGCIGFDTIVILAPQDSITVITSVTVDVLCYGQATGVAEVNAIGGVLPYTYFWPSTGATTNTVANLPAGTHNVIVTDAYGCEADTSVKIEHVYDAFTIDLDTVQQVQCFGECNGEVVLNVSGSAPPYTFNWSTGQNYYGPGPDVLSGLCQGGHQVLITDDYGCDTVVSFIIVEPPHLYAVATIVQDVTCYGLNDGEAFAIGLGGTGSGAASDYTYSWSPIFGIDNTIINLTPVWHYVTVTDTNGCSEVDSVLITQPEELFVEIPDSSAIYSYCLPTYSGTLVAQAYGGTPIYSYSWDNTVQLSDSVYNLHAGIYTVTVFDENACVATATFDLDSITNTFISDSVDASVTHVSCYAIYDGSITINGVSGSQNSPYDYVWTGPSPFTTIDSPVLNDLYAGNYSVTITDALNCPMIFAVAIDQPDILEYGVDYTVDESCIGVTGSSCNGSVILNITGGTSPYFYDNSFSGAFPILSVNQVLIVNDTLISNFCNGIYDMHITDLNGCQGYVYPSVPSPFIANIGSSVQVLNLGVNPETSTTSCFNIADGTAWVNGPTSIFNYTWESDNSGAASGIVLDTGIIYNNFLAGDYWLVSHYADSASFGINYAACDVPFNFTVDIGNVINSGAVVTNPTCYGDTDGLIDLTPTTTGIGSSFTILWDTLTSIPVANYTSEDQSQLSAGIYTVSITDNDGCILVESLLVNEPNPLIANFINLSNVTCYGDGDGKVTVLVDPNSGQGNFDYSWNTNPPSTTDALINLTGGVYTVSVTDELNCTADFDVTIIEPTPILASVEPNSFWGEDSSGDPFHIRCNGDANGSIVVGSVGGTGTVTFAWKNSIGTIVSTLQETGPILPAGSYTLVATDANGCIESETIVLNEPNLILPNIEVSFNDFDSDGIGTEVSCFGLFDGWALSSPSGGYPGVQGYSYNWANSNGQNISSQEIADNLAGLLSYTVTVSDMNNCPQSESTDIFTQPLPFNANVTTINYGGPTHAPFVVNFVDSTSSLDPYIYYWNWQDGTNDMNLEFNSEDIGANEVYIVLSNTITGCNDTVFFDIDIQGIPDIKNVFTPNSDGINDVFLFEEFGMSTVSVEIYNRWGQMVYVWDGADKSWSGVDISGEDVPEGVYFYALVAEGEDGYYYDEKGSVTLLR